MKAVRFRAEEGSNAVELVDVPDPVPNAGEVRIAVGAAGLSYVDLMFSQGRLPSPAEHYVPGSDVAGTVDAVGPDVAPDLVGQRVVASLPAFGGLAEFAVVPAGRIIALPEGMRFDDAVAVASLAPAAILALRGGRLAAGDAVFVPSAAGAVGSWLVQLASKAFGATVIAGATAADKRDLAMTLGAHRVVDTTDEGWPELVVENSGGRGADVVLVRSGGDVPGQSLRALAPGGRLVLFGAENMADTAFSKEEVAGLLTRNQSIVGVATFSLAENQTRAAVDELFGLVGRGTVYAFVSAVEGLDQVERALQDIGERRTKGKSVIIVRKEDAVAGE